MAADATEVPFREDPGGRHPTLHHVSVAPSRPDSFPPARAPLILILDTALGSTTLNVRQTSAN